MKYKYNIKHKPHNKVETINFKNELSMIKYLDKNTNKINKMSSVALHFGAIMLPLNHTRWFDKHLQITKDTI